MGYAAMMHGDLVKIDPRQALLEEVWRSASIVHWIGERVRALQEHELTQQLHDGRIVPSFLVKQYADERSHLSRVAKMAVDAGVAEAQVQIAHEQGRIMAAVIRAVVTDQRLGLDPGQVQAALSVAREQLMALPVGGDHTPQAMTDLLPPPVHKARVRQG